MSTLKIFFTSAALMTEAQSTFVGSTVTNGAGETAVGEGDPDPDGLGDPAADEAAESPLAGAPLDSAPLAGAPLDSAEPEASAPLETVTTAVTVRLAPESEPHPERISTPAIAAASTR